jgi:protein O-GlcNAc transferase
VDGRVSSLLAGYRFHDALRAIEDGERVAPEVLAAILTEVGRVDDALQLMLEVAARQPVSRRFLSQLLAISLHVEMDPAERARLHRTIGGSLGDAESVAGRPLPGRRIRLGYLSGAFCSNPEIYFLLPVLRAHDRAGFEVIAYAANAAEDEDTAEVRGLVERFVSIAAMSDEEAVEQIRRDAVDILVDCSGHFGGARPGVFARRAAPLQISYPIYPSTTGLAAVDHRIADLWTDPPESAAMYVERLTYLHHGCFVYEPPLAPSTPVLPRDRNGFVTFGVFARPAKWTTSMLKRYAQIVAATRDSRILFHHVFNGRREVEAGFRAPVEAVFAEAGVQPHRLRFHGQVSLEEHFSLLASTDLCLDTYPYHGMTTTCKCLWMGVPVVTLAGPSHVSRVGVSILSRLGMESWIAQSPEDFEEIAIRAAQDPGLAELRASLRERMRASPLLDAVGYTRELESCIRLALGKMQRGNNLH